MLSFLKKALHTKPQNKHTKHHTHLERANTSLKTVLTFLQISFLLVTLHKHKIIIHIHAKVHTDVTHVKQFSRVSSACSECSGAQEFFISYMLIYSTLYVQYV